MKLKVILATLLTVPVIAMADVNLQNGDFYISYSDISLKNNGHELEITRNYNSKSTELGWFGYGWGSKYETHLVVLPDGSAAIKENGAGRTTYYRTNNKSATKTGIQSIVNTVTMRENLTPAAADILTAQLLGDEELRLRKAIQYDIHVELLKGATLDDICGKATLTRVAEGYRRKDCNRFGDSEPATDTFDLQGRLIRHELTDGYAVTIHYVDTGTAEIRDTLGQSIALAWTPEGRVARAKANKIDVQYTYDAGQNLVTNAITDGNTYRYSYDNNHNMTRINYVDDSSMFISYSPRVNGQADAVTERNGDQQTFIYRTDPSNSKHYWTKRTVISHTGQTASKEYEFENEVSATGVTHLARTAQAVGGKSEETKFDSQGRVIRKVNVDGDVSEYTYHPQSGKIIQILNNDLKTEFKYDEQGNLIHAENSNHQVIDLDYRSTPQIQSMIEVNSAENTRRELNFKYDTAGHPTEITLVGIGKITVEYDDQGEISSVISNQGPQMALEVTQAFQNLLKVVKIAGVNF